MEQMTIILDAGWVQRCVRKNEYPAEVLRRILESMDGTTVRAQSLFKVVVEYDGSKVTEAGLRESIYRGLSRSLNEDTDKLSEYLEFQGGNRSEEPPARREGDRKPANRGRELNDAIAAIREDADAQRKREKPQAEEDAQEEPESDASERTMTEIHSLKGAQAFVQLCDELCAMAPLARKRKISHVITARSYLFSVDDGCGLSTGVTLLDRLLHEQKLLENSRRRGIEEIKLSPPGKNGAEALEEGEKEARRGENRVVCIDISAWMDQAATPEFRDFLLKLNEMERRVFVFRVPYLEQTALDRIRTALADVMTVQTILFVPLTAEEYQQVAEQRLRDFGFAVEESGWRAFHSRLAEEKSDGRFYGINTVNKVADEMMFRKLQTILCGEPEDDRIGAEHLKGLTQEQDSALSAEEQLNRLIGVETIRDRVYEIVSQIEFARKNRGTSAPAMHMRFTGAPGTGKTTVARIVGQLLRERGILSKGMFFEHSGGDFIGMYVGHTVPKTLALCRDAYGSVLFIDEAYSLADADYGDGRGFAHEAVDTLIAQMENHREDLVVIMAGYPKEMDRLMQLNPGLAGRVPFELKFPCYTREQLAQIWLSMMKKDGFNAGEGVEERVSAYFDSLPDAVVEAEDFANARFVRNLFERTWSKTVMRTQLDGSDSMTITAEDFDAAAREDAASLSEPKKMRPIGFAYANT